MTLSEFINGTYGASPSAAAASSSSTRPKHQHRVTFSADGTTGKRDDQAPHRALDDDQRDSRRDKFRVVGGGVDTEADEFIKAEHRKFLLSKTLSSSING